MLRIEMLPAAQGDAIWVEWGSVIDPFRALVDGGPATTYRHLRNRVTSLGTRPRLDLVVVTHIDRDHLEGIVRLLQDRKVLGLRVGDIWFNGWPHVNWHSKGEAQG